RASGLETHGVPGPGAVNKQVAAVPRSSAPATDILRSSRPAGRVPDGVSSPTLPMPFAAARSENASAANAGQSDPLSAYMAYQETMRKFLALEEQALATFLALSQNSGNAQPSLGAAPARIPEAAMAPQVRQQEFAPAPIGVSAPAEIA